MIEETIIKNFSSGRIQIILGPRQCGKTTLMKRISAVMNVKTMVCNGDEPDIRQILPAATSTMLRELIGGAELLIIYEAQRIKNIGLVLKLIHDNVESLMIMVSGSSSLELTNKINEPLTGQKNEYRLFPFSFRELVNHTSLRGPLYL